MTTTTTFDFDAAVADWWLIASGAPHERLQHGGAVAVVGPGSAATALRLAHALPLVTFSAVSPYPDEVEAVSVSAQSEGLAERCSFTVGRPDDLPAGRYDMVLLIHVLGSGDPDAIARRTRRVLAYDGTAVIVEPAPPPFADTDVTNTTATLTALLARAGLADVALVARSDRHIELRARRCP